MHKPFSQACVNNAPFIIEHLVRLLGSAKAVLEIGSGTGQHAVYFGEALPHLHWQTSDLEENLPGIRQWLQESGRPNLPTPIPLDITRTLSLERTYDAVFMANTLHIMSWEIVEQCIARLAEFIQPQGLLIIYGPFNYEGAYTSDSNARFDHWLKAADEARGIRDFEKVDNLAVSAGFKHQEDLEMPANNRLLVWRFEG